MITAFIVESYKTLQQQPEDITNQILIQLSTQLASLQVAGVFVNSTAPAFTFPSFKPPKSSVLINTLWSLSVVIALITASLGILIKQWFHEFLACDTQDPRERVKLRFFRDVGMKKWQVFELAAVLPLLLQLAVALFFVGLSILLYEMNPVVGWVTTSVMVAWLTVFIFATIAPAFSAQCPYKTPMLKSFFSRVRLCLPTSIFFLADKLTDFAFSHINQRYVTTETNFVYRLYRWVCDWHRGLKAFEEKEVCKDESLDMPSLVCSQDTLWGEQLNDTIIHCFQRCNVGGMFNCFQDFKNGKDAVARGLLPDVPQGMKKEVCQLYSELLIERKDLDELFRTVHFPLYFHRLQTTLTFALTESYVPIQKNPITRRPFEMLSKLIEEGSRRAAFAVLTLYCVRFNTMKNYPEHWDKLFHRPPKLPDSMCMSHYSVSLPVYNPIDSLLLANFCANTIVATRALIHVLWDHSQSNCMGNVIDIDLVDCLSSARWHSADGIPIDALVLAYTFGSLCYILPPVIVQATAPDVIGIMSQLADLMSDIDDVTPTYSRKECIGWTIRYFTFLGMVDDKLIPKLRALETQSC